VPKKAGVKRFAELSHSDALKRDRPNTPHFNPFSPITVKQTPPPTPVSNKKLIHIFTPRCQELVMGRGKVEDIGEVKLGTHR